MNKISNSAARLVNGCPENLSDENLWFLEDLDLNLKSPHSQIQNYCTRNGNQVTPLVPITINW